MRQKNIIKDQIKKIIKIYDKNLKDYKLKFKKEKLFLQNQHFKIKIKIGKFTKEDIEHNSEKWINYLTSKILLLINKSHKSSCSSSSSESSETSESSCDIIIANCIVVIKDDCCMDDVDTTNITIIDKYDIINGFSCVASATCMENMRRCQYVKGVYENTIMSINATATNNYLIRTGAIYSSAYASPPVPLLPNLYCFVIDTGIQPNHPELNVIAELSRNFISTNTGDWADKNGHGTHVGGIIGAKNVGTTNISVAPNAQLVAIRVLDANGSGFTSNIIAGLNYIYNWKIANPTNIGIGNMSLGGSINNPLDTAVNKLVNANVSVCVAAGNSAANAKRYSPARVENAITVGAYNSVTNIWATFSNYGSLVDILAPGVNIYSTYLNSGYSTLSGTSMATPVVAGTLAVMLSQNPKLTTSTEIRNKLITDSALLLPPLYNSTIKGKNPRINLSRVAISAKTTNIGVFSGSY